MGKIIFFDRNDVQNNENDVQNNENKEILCQIQLSEHIVVTRGDRFILRKPSPVETMGGGWIINPKAKKYRFGKATIKQLEQQKTGSANDRISALLHEKFILTQDEIMKKTALSEKDWQTAKVVLIELENGRFTLQEIVEHLKVKTITMLKKFHDRFPMRIGINKAEITSELHPYPLPLLDFVFKQLQNEKKIKVMQHFISIYSWKPTLPSQWKTKLTNAEKTLQQQGFEPEKWLELMHEQQIPDQIQKEFYYYLIDTEKAFTFDDERLISKSAVNKALQQLKANTDIEFTLQIARDILQLSRKNLIPLLELLDELGYTRRVANKRTWINKG